MSFDEDPDPIFLLNTLVQMEFSFLEFNFSSGVVEDIEEVFKAIELLDTKKDCLQQIKEIDEDRLKEYKLTFPIFEKFNTQLIKNNEERDLFSFEKEGVIEINEEDSSLIIHLDSRRQQIGKRLVSNDSKTQNLDLFWKDHRGNFYQQTVFD